MKYLILTLSAFALPLSLTACGFTPMHSTASAAGFENLAITLEDGRDLGDEQGGFYVQQRLRDRIGINTAAKHELKITVAANRRRLGITDQDVASRYDTTLGARYSLVEIKTGKILDKGRVSSVTTFGAPQDAYGVVTADNNSKQQAAKELADRLLNSLAAYYASNPAP